MATDLEKLVVQLSADFRQFEKGMAKASDVTNRQFNAIERRARQMNKNLDGIFKSTASHLAAPLAGIGAAFGAAELIRLTDVWTDLNSRVSLAAGSMEKGQEVMGRIGEMARRTYSSLEQTAESYISNASSLKELGYATDDQLNYTEALNNALVISAAKGQRAEAVQNALSKAMAGGKLQGENLNTVIEQGGRVAEALAAGLGVGVNQLRALGAQGKITSRDVFQALTSQMQTLRREAEAMPATISDGVQLLKNALLEYVGNADKATGVSRNISDALVLMADNFDTTADVALQLAGVIAGALIGRSLMGMIRTLGLAGTALVGFTRALAAARTMAGITAALSGVSAAAGPVGLVVGGAVVAALTMFSSSSAEATEAAKIYAQSLEEVRARASEAAGEVKNVASEIDTRGINSLTLALDDAQKILQASKTSLLEFLDALTGDYSMSFATPEQQQQLEELRKGLDNGSISADKAIKAIFAMANADYNFQIAAEKLAPLLDALREAVEQVDNLRAKLNAKTSFPSWADSERTSMGAYREMEKINQAFIESQTKQNELSKHQLAIETEIAKVKKEAIAAGAVLTDKQIRDIATSNVAAGDRRSAEGKKTREPKKTSDDRFDSLTQSINDRIEAMRLEQQTLGATFKEQQKRAVALDLEQEALRQVREEARKKGDQDWQNAQLSPEQVKRIDEVSEAYARQADELRQAQEAQAFQRDMLKGVFGDLRSALEDGKLDWKDLGDIAMSALDKIIDKIENDLIDAIMQANSAADGSGGGLLGWLTKGLGALLGGGSGFTPNTTLAGVLGVPGYAEGTNNHPGGLAIVGEKGPELLNLPRGSQVIPQLPQMPSFRGTSQQATRQEVHVTVGWSRSADGNLTPLIEQVSQKNAQAVVARYDKGSAYRTSRALGEVAERGYGG